MFFIVLIASILANIIGYFILEFYLKKIKPMIIKKFTEKDTAKTNVYSLTGKKAIVIEDIDWTTGSGQIKFEGQVWSAKTEEQVNIAKGTEVEIVKIEGVKAFVKPLHEYARSSY